MIRVVLADDHAVVREGIRRVLEDEGAFTVVAEAANAADLLVELGRVTADVLVLDIAMPGPGIIEVLREVKAIQPRARSLVLTGYPEAEYAVRVLRAGAAGYLTKDRSLEQLVEAVRRVYRGGIYVSPSLGESLAARLLGPEREPSQDRHDLPEPHPAEARPPQQRGVGALRPRARAARPPPTGHRHPRHLVGED